MPDTEFSKIAQQMVEATSPLVSGRTVNIMDTDGFIIASTEKERIGTLHSVAAQAVKTGRPVAVEKDQVDAFVGAKEGYNMPMYSGGRLLGVVGIYGNPKEVYDTAKLLSAYTVQYFEHNAHLQQQMVEKELRNKLLALLLNLDTNENDSVTVLMKALHIKLAYPVRVMAIGMQHEMDSVGSLHIFNSILDQMRSRGYLDPERDVWGVHDNRITVIKSHMSGNDAEQIEHIGMLLKESSMRPFQICAGYMCENPAGIRESAAQAYALFEAGKADVLDITDTSCFLQYILYRAELQNGSYVRSLYDKLLQCLGKKETAVALETAACYYHAQCSVTRAADVLHIHKNTLQYRMRRLWDALNIEKLTPFERELLVRLCIRHDLRNRSKEESGIL